MSDVPTTKVCTKCGVEKGLEEFGIDPRVKIGRAAKCRACYAVSSKIRHSKNRDKDNAWLREYRRANKQYVRQQAKIRHESDPRIRILHSAKGRAKGRGRTFAITTENIVIPAACPVLNIRIEPGNGQLHSGSPSLDEMTIPHGYQPWNQKVISHRANALKSNATPVESARIALYQAECQQNYISHLEAENESLKEENRRLQAG
jgi:hypothetical protein